MTKYKKAIFSFIGLYVFAAISLACAQNAPDGDNPPPPPTVEQHVQGIFAQLDLTPDQKQALEANKRQHRLAMQSVHQQLKADREALREAIMSPQLDMNSITQIHNQIKVLEAQMEDDKLNSILAVRSILTPQQFAIFISLMDKHKK